MSTAEKVLDVLADVTEVDEVRRIPDLRLYNLDILDSLKTIELIVAFSEKLGVEVSPVEIDRDQSATPSGIVAFMEDRSFAPYDAEGSAQRAKDRSFAPYDAEGSAQRAKDRLGR